MPEATGGSVADLYRLEPAAFTAARDALAKSLRAAGDKQAATKVKALRRPPLTAWALNRVATDAPDAVSRVLDAGAALRDATRAAMAGDAGPLRAAQTREREAVSAAIDVATSVLASSGHAATDAARQTMERTLRAAFVDEDVAARLQAGTLQADEAAFGFGADQDTELVAMAADRPAATGRKVDADQRAAQAERERAARSRRIALEDKAARLSRTAEQLRRRAIEAEHQAGEAKRAADDAEREAFAAREALADLGGEGERTV